jgi:hypothetical protein
VSREAVRQTATRFAWPARAAAYDSSCLPAAELPSVLQPAIARRADNLDPDYALELEEFREQAERLGKAHVRLARGLSTAAARNAARILASDKPLSPRDICALANASVLLANSGQAMWGKAIGVETLLAQVQQNTIAAAQVEVID